MSTYDPRIDAYIGKSADFAKPVLSHLRELIHASCPDVEENWKWSFPNFMYRGRILCSMAAFKEHCSFGFWHASLITDTDNVLEITDSVSMGHLGRIQSLNDLPKDSILKKYIKAAMRLNEEGEKLPPRKKATEEAKKELTTPADFEKLLIANKAAFKVFEEFNYSKKKEYLEWFEEAKTEATRNKRIAQALDWLAEGKIRHWKYQNC